jgi:hypothetical protein
MKISAEEFDRIFDEGIEDMFQYLDASSDYCPAFEDWPVDADWGEKTVVRDGVVFAEDMKTLIYYPQSKKDPAYEIPAGVTTVGFKAFYGCKNLKKLTTPDGLTAIGFEAFCWCKNLTEIALPDSVTIIGAGAFENCRSLTAFAVPAGVTVIEENAFAYAKRLQAISAAEGAGYAARDGVQVRDCRFSGIVESVLWPRAPCAAGA